jgi:putative transposase
MPHSFSQIYIHTVWAVKNREPVLQKSVRIRLFCHIFEQYKNSDFKLIAMGGIENHIHCLIRLPTSKTISEVVKLIKGESSFWLNSTNAINGTFCWQNGYSAFSVSPHRVDHIKHYIHNQEQHHKAVSFEEELKKFSP